MTIQTMIDNNLFTFDGIYPTPPSAPLPLRGGELQTSRRSLPFAGAGSYRLPGFPLLMEGRGVALLGRQVGNHLTVGGIHVGAGDVADEMVIGVQYG